MSPLKILALVLVVAGVVALLYGGFQYTKETHDVKLGPVEFSLKEKEKVKLPPWVGVASIATGVVLLLASGKR